MLTHTCSLPSTLSFLPLLYTYFACLVVIPFLQYILTESDLVSKGLKTWCQSSPLLV